MTLLMIGTGEIIVIALIIVLLFGARKIPELMKSIGKGMKAYKDGVNGVEEEKKDETPKEEMPKEEKKDEPK